MSDPSILLLLTCVTCADSPDSFAHPAMLDCSTVEASVQPQRSGRLESAIDCTHSVSAPEVIPAFITTASQPVAAVQTTAQTVVTEGAIAPPEPFILPETFTKPPTATNAPQSNQSSSANSTSVELPGSLRLSSRGEAVSRLQERLQQLGHYTGAIDGIYGQLTLAAVTEFQQAEGLTVDGIAGPVTWGRLQVSAASTTPSTQPNRLTARLGSGDASGSAPATTESPSPDRAAQTAESERTETASTAGETAANASTAGEGQIPPTEDTDQVEDADLEQSSADRESQQSPEFVFDTSPSGIPFYFWIGAWAIFYIGGMVFIFKDNIISKLGLTWGTDDTEPQDIQLPTFGPQTTMGEFASALDYGQSSDDSDGFGAAISNSSKQEKQNLVSQHDSPLYFSREGDSPSQETENLQTDSNPPSRMSNPPIFSLLEKLAYESPRLSNQELTPVWADGGVVEPVRGLFSDLPHPLGGQPSERRRNKAIAPPPPPPGFIQSQKQSSNQAEAPSTLIATLPDEDPETNNSYTYALLDNAEGYFLLKGNELRIYDSALVQIESDVDHAITLRRTDAKGTQVDKSFVVNFTKTDDDDAAEVARSA
ncbi:peptidoglycan-binding protein [Leptolyngbya sp. FACHB-541]|uniref:peptidoglycan-binding domain-containing protein n=1 Tax=Leptolyngbya sp. FACHB-541 TaxID=2692810 RepID=UPI0016838B3F|nr:peptidoglycan-binding domain-containing protein [Leptolyngbya sp. FACHB-541]MBD2001147.1 peptidoglycan-binding protein [Leptolyngbya sp. FACHB-541]